MEREAFDRVFNNLSQEGREYLYEHQGVDEATLKDAIDNSDTVKEATASVNAQLDKQALSKDSNGNVTITLANASSVQTETISTSDQVKAVTAELQEDIATINAKDTAQDSSITSLQSTNASLQTTLENISKTGEASAASNVTFNTTDTGLVSTNVQEAIKEVKDNIPSVTQETGDSETSVMSQKAVTEIVDDAGLVYDCSEKGTVSYADLSAAIAAVPTLYQKGGLEIRYMIDGATDYQSSRLNNSTWSDNTMYWETANASTLSIDEIDDNIGGISRKMTLKGSYYINIFNYFVSSNNHTMYIAKVSKGDIVRMVGTLNYSGIWYTTDDLTGMTVAEVVAANPTKTKVFASSENSDSSVNRWIATVDCWVICAHGATQPIPTVISKGKFEALQAEVEMSGSTLVKTYYDNITDNYDNSTYQELWFRAVLDGADSIDLVMNENSSTDHSINITEDGVYHLRCNNASVWSVKVTFNGTKGDKGRVEVYSDYKTEEVNTAVESATEMRFHVMRKYTINGGTGKWICYKYEETDARYNPVFPKYTVVRIKCTNLGTATSYSIVTGSYSNGYSNTLLPTDATDVDKEWITVCDGSQTYFRINVTGDSAQTVFEAEIGEPVWDIAEQNRQDIVDLKNTWMHGHELELRDGFNFNTLLNKVYNSSKTTSNTEATLKRISKSAYGYAHVSLMEIVDGTVYMMHMQNASYSDGEKNTTTGYELVMEYFTLDRYNADDFDCETDVTTVVLGKIGSTYTDAGTSTEYTAVRAPGDGSFVNVSGTLYIVHPIRPADSDDETVISYQFSTTDNAVVDGTTNVCKLVYGDDTYDFTTANVKEIFNSAGYYTEGINSINVSSNFVVHNSTYYNVIAGAGELNGALISTTDFITFTIVDFLSWNIGGADEVMLCGPISANYIIVAARQMYGITNIKYNVYDAYRKYWTGLGMLPAANSRPYMWKASNTVGYIIWPTSDNRDLWQVASLTISNKRPYFTQICSIPKLWDYPCIYVYNSTPYFSASLNGRRQIYFGKLQLSTTNIVTKFISVIDKA